MALLLFDCYVKDALPTRATSNYTACDGDDTRGNKSYYHVKTGAVLLEWIRDESRSEAGKL